MRKVTFVVLTLLLLVGAHHLSAAAPIMNAEHRTFDRLVGLCNGFQVWERGETDVFIKIFVNKQGDWIKIKERYAVVGELYNASNPNSTLPYKVIRYTVTFDPVTGAAHATGLWAHLTVPGYGAILMDVGHIGFDGAGNIIHWAGQHDWWEFPPFGNADVEAVCDLLGD